MIIESEVCQAHEHMPEEIPPKMSVSSFVGFLKGKSSLMVYERWSNIKFKYRNVDTAGKNAHKIAEYIQHHLKEDAVSDQLTSVLSALFGWQVTNAPAGALYAVQA